MAHGPDITLDLPAGARVVGDTVGGAFAEYVAVPAVNAYPLPGHLDARQGAMVEPVACTVHGLRRLGPVFGDSVALIGMGTMGLLLLQLLLHARAFRWGTEPGTRRLWDQMAHPAVMTPIQCSARGHQ